MNSRAYRKQWIKLHKQYELKAFRLIRKELREKSLLLPFDTITIDNFDTIASMYFTDNFFKELITKIYLEIGTTHAKKTIRYINKQINQKNLFDGGIFSEFALEVQRYLTNTAFQNIVSVRQTYIQYLKQVITTGIDNNLTLPEIVKEMQRVIKSRNFYKYQAFRIARTETTSAANYGAFKASNSLGVAMDKVWISAQDKRTRRTPPDKYDHYHMNGVKIPLEKPFIVSGDEMMFPADQENGDAGNIINCRCTMSQVIRRDNNGNIVRI
jgi:hypothetical protein